MTSNQIDINISALSQEQCLGLRPTLGKEIEHKIVVSFFFFVITTLLLTMFDYKIEE
jgi:hypothetical protein